VDAIAESAPPAERERLPRLLAVELVCLEGLFVWSSEGIATFSIHSWNEVRMRLLKQGLP